MNYFFNLIQLVRTTCNWNVKSSASAGYVLIYGNKYWYKVLATLLYVCINLSYFFQAKYVRINFVNNKIIVIWSTSFHFSHLFLFPPLSVSLTSFSFHLFPFSHLFLFPPLSVSYGYDKIEPYVFNMGNLRTSKVVLNQKSVESLIYLKKWILCIYYFSIEFVKSGENTVT